MKKSLVFMAVTVLVLTASVGVLAASFEADGSYLFGETQFNDTKSKDQGFLVNAAAEIYSNIFVDGSLLSVTGEVEGAENKPAQRLMLIGAKYRVLGDEGLEVFAGGGWGTYDYEDLDGKGIFGKLGLRFDVHPAISIVGDVSYAPKFKSDVAEGVDGLEGTLLSGRASVSYQVMSDLGIQATIMHNTVDMGTEKVTSTLYGGGIVLRF
ncbi:MAG: hypothetical protein GX331_02660 [Firmicutes bacterium]|nr:hypothetical protein [Bacillota bacterium]